MFHVCKEMVAVCAQKCTDYGIKVEASEKNEKKNGFLSLVV